MSVRVLTEPRKKELGMIVDADVDHVSLVRHGANRQPFRVVKSEEGGRMPLIIQSFTVPSGTSLDTIKSDPALAWTNDLKTEKPIEKGDYTEYPQIPRDQFDESSLQLKKLGNTGAFYLAGTLKEGVKADGLSLPAEPDKVALTSEERPPITLSFADLFFRELDGFVGVVQSTMKQTQLKPGARKSTIMDAHKAFGSFLSMGLDKLNEVLNEGMQKADFGEELQGLRDSVQQIILAPIQENGGLMEMFQSKEELAAFITDTVKTAMKAETKVVDEKPEKEAETIEEKKETKPVEENKETKPDPEIEKRDKEIADLKEQVRGLMEKTDNLSQNLATTSHADKSDENTTEETDQQRKEREKLEKWEEQAAGGVAPEDRADVFKGTIINWPDYLQKVDALKKAGIATV